MIQPTTNLAHQLLDAELLLDVRQAAEVAVAAVVREAGWDNFSRPEVTPTVREHPTFVVRKHVRGGDTGFQVLRLGDTGDCDSRKIKDTVSPEEFTALQKRAAAAGGTHGTKTRKTPSGGSGVYDLVPPGFRGQRIVWLTRKGQPGSVSTRVITHTRRGGSKNEMTFAVSLAHATELHWFTSPTAVLSDFAKKNQVTNPTMVGPNAKGWYFFGLQSQGLQEAIEADQAKTANQPRVEAAKRQRFNRVTVKAVAAGCDQADVDPAAQSFLGIEPR